MANTPGTVTATTRCDYGKCRKPASLMLIYPGEQRPLCTKHARLHVQSTGPAASDDITRWIGHSYR
jgi:hypothetical protein